MSKTTNKVNFLVTYDKYNLYNGVGYYEFLKLPPQATVLNSKTLPPKQQNVRRTLPHLSPLSDGMVDHRSVASGVVWVSLPEFVTTSDGMQDGGVSPYLCLWRCVKVRSVSLRRFLFMVWVSDHHDGGLQ